MQHGRSVMGGLPQVAQIAYEVSVVVEGLAQC
jgi:hypothetical protein